MHPVDQTKFYGETTRGNCLEACLASILNKTLGEIPTFAPDGPATTVSDYYDAFEAYLESIDYAYMLFHGPVISDKYHIAVGTSERGVKHAVVRRNGEIIHDPHFSRAGLQTIDHVYFLIPKTLWRKA